MKTPSIFQMHHRGSRVHCTGEQISCKYTELAIGTSWPADGPSACQFCVEGIFSTSTFRYYHVVNCSRLNIAVVGIVCKYFVANSSIVFLSYLEFSLSASFACLINLADLICFARLKTSSSISLFNSISSLIAFKPVISLLSL